jgi:hypothetical protein
MIWARKDWDLKTLHLNVFKHIRYLIADWIDYKDPKQTKKLKEEYVDLKKSLAEFEYRPEGWATEKPFTKEDFMKMSLEE